MKNLFDNVNDILDAEKILENYFNPNINKTNMIAASHLSENDCLYLLAELTKLGKANTPISFYKEIPLCILAVWTFALRYENKNPLLKEHVFNYSETVPQHHFRFYVEILTNAIAEFSIDTFGINYTTAAGLETVLDLHAEYGYSDGICA